MCIRDSSKALEYFEEVLKIRLSVYGENHSRVASVYNDIGEIYSCLLYTSIYNVEKQ